MTETDEQRIERVVKAMRAIPESAHDDQVTFVRRARAADEISFAVGWDAAVEALRKPDNEMLKWLYEDAAVYPETGKRFCRTIATFLADRKPIAK